MQDLLDPKIFGEKLEVALKEKNLLLTRVYGRLPIERRAIEEEYLGYAERLQPHIADTARFVQRRSR